MTPATPGPGLYRCLPEPPLPVRHILLVVSSSGITQDELAEAQEWQEQFPRSEAIWAEGYDEGEARLSEDPFPPAVLREYRRGEGYAAEILNWYQAALSGKGWTRSEDVGPKVLGATYRRERPGRREEFWILIRNREAMAMPPRGARHPGTTFEIGYRASSVPGPADQS